MATSMPSTNRPVTIVHSVVRPRNATNVEAITTGLRTGAASMKVIAADGVSPRSISRRATGTEPHSQIGNSIPASAAAGSCKGRESRPSRSSAATGTKISTSAAASAPITTNGSAWTSNDPKMTRKVRTHSMLSTPVERTATAAATSTRSTAPSLERCAVPRAGAVTAI